MTKVRPLDMDVTVTHLVRDPVHDTEKPYELWMQTEPGVPKNSCQYEDKVAHVSDVRSSTEDFDVDRNGFKYLQHTSQCLPRFEDLSWEYRCVSSCLPDIYIMRASHNSEAHIVLPTIRAKMGTVCAVIRWVSAGALVQLANTPHTKAA
jgi:hypothetical protein